MLVVILVEMVTMLQMELVTGDDEGGGDNAGGGDNGDHDGGDDGDDGGDGDNATNKADHR